MRRTCAANTRGVAQAPLLRQAQQLVVRDAAPEEERQPRGQLEVAEAVDGVRRPPAAGRARRGRGTPGPTGCGAAANCTPPSNVPRRAASFVEELQQVREVVRADRAAGTPAAASGRDDAPGAGPFLGGRRAGRQAKMRAAAGRIAGAGRVEGPRDADAVHARDAVHVHGVHGRPQRLQEQRIAGAGLVEERDADRVRPRLDRDAHLQPRVDGVRYAGFASDLAPVLRRRRRCARKTRSPSTVNSSSWGDTRPRVKSLLLRYSFDADDVVGVERERAA